MSGPPPKVFVVDDDGETREALQSLLRSIGMAVESFASAADFLAADPPDAPSCLVLDIRMPGASGLDLQDELRRRGVETPIVFVTGHGDIPMTVRAMKAGAVEFLAKPFREQDLLDAVNAALDHDRDRRRETAALDELRRRFASLTPREREVMELVVTGLLNKQVAAAAGLSEITVKAHRGQAMRKMGARSLAELVRMADRLGLSPKAG